MIQESTQEQCQSNLLALTPIAENGGAKTLFGTQAVRAIFFSLSSRHAVFAHLFFLFLLSKQQREAGEATFLAFTGSWKLLLRSATGQSECE
jgi:hypothetical protein